MRASCLGDFVRDSRASILAPTAIIMATLLGFAALGLDSGLAYNHKRRQQAATDLAALAAASSIGALGASASSSAAMSVASSNGYAGGTASGIVLEPGLYVSDPTIPSLQRFTPQTSGLPNAVRVTMTQPHHFVFGPLVSTIAGGLGLMADPTIRTQSIAAARHLAAFDLGSGLASMNGGILNSVLGSLLGSQISLSTNDYQSLASTNISLFTFSSILATQVGLTGGTYSDLANLNVSLPTVLAALTKAAASTSASPALALLSAAAGSSGNSFKLGSLVNFGPYGTTVIGVSGPTTATIDLFDFVSAILQAANGGSQVEAPLNVNLPGILSASVKLSIGEPAVGSSLVAVGPTATQLSTTQTRIRLTLQLGGPTPTTVLSVPIILNIASGTASVSSIQCSGGVTTSTVQLAVTPGFADAWIGSASDQDLLAMGVPLNPPPATLANVMGIVKVTGSAHASIAQSGATMVPFTYSDVAAGTRKTVSMSDFLSPLISSLFGNLHLTITALGAIPINSAAMNLAVAQTLAADAVPIDSILSSILTGLGVSVGNATTWVSSVQCGEAVLVN